MTIYTSRIKAQMVLVLVFPRQSYQVPHQKNKKEFDMMRTPSQQLSGLFAFLCISKAQSLFIEPGTIKSVKNDIPIPPSVSTVYETTVSAIEWDHQMSLPFATLPIEAADDKIRLMISHDAAQDVKDAKDWSFLAVRRVKIANGDAFDYPYVCVVDSERLVIESWELYGRWCDIGKFHTYADTFTLTYHDETWITFELAKEQDWGSCETRGEKNWTEIGITNERSGHLSTHHFSECKRRVGRGRNRLVGVFTDQVQEHPIPFYWEEMTDTVIPMTERLTFEFNPANLLLLPRFTWKYESWGWFGSGFSTASNGGVVNPFSRWNWQHGRMWWMEVPLKMDAIKNVLPPNTTLASASGYLFAARYPVWRYNRAHPLSSFHPHAQANFPYREIVLRILVRYQGTVYQHAITIIVDQPRPMMSGRYRLGTPKILADFDGTVDLDTINVIALNSEDKTFEMSLIADRSDQPHEGPVPHLSHDDLSIVPLAIGEEHSFLIWQGKHRVGSVNNKAKNCRVKFGERIGQFVENKCTRSGVIDLNWGDDTLGSDWPVHQQTIPYDYWQNVSTLVWPKSMLSRVHEILWILKESNSAMGLKPN